MMIILVVQKFVHLCLQIFSVIGGSHAQLLFVDKHGLLGLPFTPGLLGHGIVDFLALGARIGWHRQAR